MARKDTLRFGHPFFTTLPVEERPVAAGVGRRMADIDKACTQSGIMPDVGLAAHAHSYQRFTRTVSFNGRQMKIPFLLVGSGGRGLQPVSLATG